MQRLRGWGIPIHQSNIVAPRLALVLLAALLLAACASARPPAATLPPSPTSYLARLVCDECAEVGLRIHLWETADRAGLRTVGSVPSGTQVNVLGWDVVDGAVMYNVSAGGVTGWVSRDMVEK